MTSNAVDAAQHRGRGRARGRDRRSDRDAGAPGGNGAEPVEAAPETPSAATGSRERQRH